MTKNKKQKETIRRIPRPLGTTYSLIQSQSLPETNKQELKEQLYRRIIQGYINDGMQLNGQYKSINQVANYLNIHPNKALTIMNKEIMRVARFFDGDEGKDIARAQLILGLKKSLEIMALTQSQTTLLSARQGDKYVPYLTGEVNKSLANLINAQKPMLDWVKEIQAAMKADPTMPKSADNQYITAEEAMKLISSGPDKPITIEAFQASLGELPDVNARNQDLSSIGVRIPKKNPSLMGTNEASKGMINGRTEDNRTDENNANLHNNRPNRVPNEPINPNEFIA